MLVGVAATAPFGADVLAGLSRLVEVSFCLTRPDRPRGRGRKVAATAAKQRAEALGIPVLQPERLGPELELPADVVVLCAYGALIPEYLLERQLWLNVHPSLLPRWRGAAPVERALMEGDRETGVTIHRTVRELDAGPIAAQHAFRLPPDADAGAVYARAAGLAVELLAAVLPDPAFVPQPTEGVTYADKIGPADRELDWSHPAPQSLNRIRALSPHIGAWGMVGGRRILVWRARPATTEAALVAGGLELLEVQPEGGRRMRGDEYLRGLRA